ncbi:MAG TPA: hypothetical protein VF020_07800 [Chthoniobacterales bacterium]
MGRIQNATATEESFSPRYAIELTPGGTGSIPPLTQSAGFGLVRPIFANVITVNTKTEDRFEENIKRAHALIESGRSIGKIVSAGF